MSDHHVSSIEQLRQIYREPAELVANKKGPTVVGATAEFVAASRFFCLATSDAEGNCDVSPRGGAPGHLKVIEDGTQVAFPDLSGNNLVDSLTNICENPHAGLLVMVAGSDETLRIDGTAHITTDPAILALWENEVRGPKVAVVITVDSAFLHCAKAFRRGAVWQPEEWGQVEDTLAPAMFNDTAGTDIEPSDLRGFLEAGYEQSLNEERPAP